MYAAVMGIETLWRYGGRVHIASVDIEPRHAVGRKGYGSAVCVRQVGVCASHPQLGHAVHGLAAYPLPSKLCLCCCRHAQQ